MKKVIYTLLIVIVLTPLNLSSTSIGAIGSDCGRFIQEDRQNSEFVRTFYGAIFQSYVSALEWHSKENRAKNLTGDSLYYSILKMCKDEPTERLDETVLKFYFEKL